jgi:hypothetical protein
MPHASLPFVLVGEGHGANLWLNPRKWKKLCSVHESYTSGYTEIAAVTLAVPQSNTSS